MSAVQTTPVLATGGSGICSIRYTEDVKGRPPYHRWTTSSMAQAVNNDNSDNTDNLTGVTMNANRGDNVDNITTEEQRSTGVEGKILPYNRGGKGDNNKKLRPLTFKERRYTEERIKGKTQTQAVQAVYDVKPDVAQRTLRNMAQTIEHRPAVLAVLTEHAVKAEQMLVKLAEDTTRYAATGTKEGAMYASTAERTLNSMLDRVHGKAKQQLEVQSTSVNISIDMSAQE